MRLACQGDTHMMIGVHALMYSTDADADPRHPTAV